MKLLLTHEGARLCRLRNLRPLKRLKRQRMDGKELDRALIELCTAFNKYRVKYVIVGGFAVIMHGLARMTEDIDFFIEDSAENIEKIKTALKSLYNDPTIDDLKSEDIKKYAG